jgi:signal transduction histidine kinase/CheY-like chemotaxis protein/HPt (histidine-containing phosphotransfer) domain-containing protein
MGIEPEVEQAWEPGSACSAETVAARAPLSADERRLMMSSLGRRYLPTMLICAGIAYEGLAIGHWSTGADQTELKLMTIYGLAGIAMLALGWRAHRQPPRLAWSLHIGGAAFLVVTATVTLAYALDANPYDFYVYLLIQLAAGALVHDWRWLVAIMIFGDLGWGITSLWVQDVNWVKSLGYLFGFSAITVGIHFARSRALIQMEELRLAAERASQAKTDLLANVSHEVRTPMNGVLGLSALLLDTDLDEKQKKMISAIRESADALVGIVDEILDFSQLQKGQVELDKAPFDLRALIDGVVDLMQPRADAKGIRLESDTPGSTSQRFLGDSGRIRQVLLNLVNNAIKFTDSGSVQVRSEVLGRGEKARIRLSVHDTGVGIPEDLLQGIFTRYQRSNGGSKRRTAGNGLGLAISKQLVELMDGELGVRSTVDEGTCFWAEFDLGLGQDTTLRVIETDGRSQVLIREGARVLVAEDDPTSRMVTEALLKKLCCEVDIARDGREALEKAKANDYDIVFMDCYMPLIDGFQATKRIRQSPDKEELPIVALTASIDEKDRARCLDAGMNDVVCKPVRTSMLAQALERWVPLSGARPTKSVSTLPPPPALNLNLIGQLVSLDGEDDEFIQDVLLGYVDQLRASVTRMRTALNNGDMEAARLSAHTVKGASKQIGATRVGELLGGIEGETSIDAARNLLEVVEQELPRVDEAIQGLLSRPRRAG